MTSVFVVYEESLLCGLKSRKNSKHVSKLQLEPLDPYLFKRPFK